MRLKESNPPLPQRKKKKNLGLRLLGTMLQVYCLEQEVAHPFPELTESGSLFIWRQSLANVISHQLDQ